MSGWGQQVPKRVLSQIAIARQQLDRLEAEYNRMVLERDRAQAMVDRYVALHGPLGPDDGGC